MTKQHVLFEASPIVDSQMTGVGRYAMQLIRAVASESKASLLFDGYYFDFLGRRHKRPPSITNVSFHRIRLVPGRLLSITRRLGFQLPLELFTARKSDIVLFTNYVALALAKKRKIALCVYDLSFLDHPEYTQEKNLRFLQRFCPNSIRSADLIITISEFTKQRIEHYFPDIKAEIVITPIPPTETTGNKIPLPTELATAGIKSKKFILYVGTIEPRKNLENLVEAYAQLPKETRDTYALVLAGGNGWKNESILDAINIQQAAGLNIILTGYVSDKTRSALYQHAACFVLPSHYEGFGMPIFEAFQYDVPVVASDIPVFREIADDAVAYFDKDNRADIARVLAHVLASGSLQKTLTTRGHVRLGSYSWKENARIVSEAFNRLLA